MRDYTVFCQEGKRIDSEAGGVRMRVVLCGKVGKMYRIPGSVHDVSLCGEHIRLPKYDSAVEIQ